MIALVATIAPIEAWVKGLPFDPITAAIRDDLNIERNEEALKKLKAELAGPGASQ